MTKQQNLDRAAFLIRWFLKVYGGRKAPFPRKCFRGMAHHMEQFLKHATKKE
jgi:hypothetical protein